MKFRAIVVAVALLGGLFIAWSEFKAAFLSNTSDPKLSDLIVKVVEENSSFVGRSFLNEVTGFICPNISRYALDQLADRPGNFRIRTVDDYAPPHGPSRGYYITPRVSIFRGLWRWISRPGLQIELRDDGRCFSAVRRGDAI